MQNQSVQNTSLWAKLAVKGIVVFELGSFNLRFGLISKFFNSNENGKDSGEEEFNCFSMPHCIAWRKKTPSNTTNNNNNLSIQQNDIRILNNSTSNTDDSKESIENAIVYLEKLFNVNKETLPQTNISINVEIIPKEKDNFDWTDISKAPPYIVGEDALFLDPSDPYELFFPIKYGHFNTNPSEGKQRPRHLILNDLQTIWEYVVTRRLGLKLNELKEYCVAFAIPDVFDKREVKEILNIFLNNMHFRAAFIHKSSVCAAIGAGYPTACIVDIGFSKTNIACVDDGDVIPGTAFHFHYGGFDISRFFLYLLQHHQRPSFPYKECDLNRISDLLILEEMKETCCHLNKVDIYTKLYEFCVRERGKDSKLYRLKIDEAQFLAPLALFNPHAFDPLTKHETMTQEYDYEDFTDEFISTDLKKQIGLIQSRMKAKPKLMKKKEQERHLVEMQQQQPQNEMISITYDEDFERNIEEDVSTHLATHEEARLLIHRRRVMKLKLVVPDELIDHTFPVSVPQAIVESIGNVSDSTLRRTLFSRIILTGASSMFEGLSDLVEERVFYTMPREIETVEVLSFPQFRDPKNFAWCGLAILSKLALTNSTLWTEDFNYWISYEEWNRKGGGRILREKLPFSWDCNTFNKVE